MKGKSDTLSSTTVDLPSHVEATESHAV